jgi:hypothetical protein
MPLVTTTPPIILVAETPWAVGFWMQVSGTMLDDFVWIIATYECIEDLDHPNELADQYNAVAIAENNRALLEKAASAKFDRKGINPDDGTHERKPVLKLHSYDLPD